MSLDADIASGQRTAVSIAADIAVEQRTLVSLHADKQRTPVSLHKGIASEQRGHHTLAQLATRRITAGSTPARGGILK